jgi:hypothetical protein
MPIAFLRGKLAFFWSLLALACSQSETPIGAGNSPGVDAATPSGRVVSDDGKLTLEVPAGALPENQTVTIAVAADPPPGVIGTAYELGPSGVSFAQPVTLKFALPESTQDVAVARVENGAWAQLRVQSMDSLAVTSFTDHFSIYGLVSTPYAVLSSQATRYARACDIDCASISSGCAGDPMIAVDGCAALATGWSVPREVEHMACIEDALGAQTPARTSMETLPCTRCLRDCSLSNGYSIGASLNYATCLASRFFDLREPGFETISTSMSNCLRACVAEPLPPGPNELCGAGSGEAHITLPTVRSAQRTVVESGSIKKGDATLIPDLLDPTAIALDRDGNIYFGELASSPVRVTLKKRTTDGAITELGTVVDTSAGFVEGSWAFALAVSPKGDVVFNSPRIMGPSQQVVQPGSLRTLGGEEIVGNLSSPAGLAYDAAGNLYYGDVTSSPVRVRLFKRDLNGTITDLGQVVDTGAGSVTMAWAFDVAVSATGDVYYTTPTIFSFAPGAPPQLVELGSVRMLGGATVVTGESPMGLGASPDGTLFYAEVTSGPLRVQLKRRASDGTITDLGRVVDTTVGFVTGPWRFDLAVGP